MVKRTYSKDYNEEPEEKKFDLPSPKEHLFQVVDIYDINNCPFEKKLDENTVVAKCEVVGGDEEGRTILQRLTLDEDGKGFWATRLFLKAINQDYKGKGLTIDTDFWCGMQFYASVIHNGQYANIKEYNFDKRIEQVHKPKPEIKEVLDPKDIAWED
jgi:hypothetical protein